jgi:hypothetical protein
VAVVGSVLASVYGSKVGDFLVGKPVPSGVAESMKQSLGIALSAGGQITGLASVAKEAFVDGLHAGVLVAAGIALLGALVAFLWLPARASYDVNASDDAHTADEPATATASAS